MKLQQEITLSDSDSLFCICIAQGDAPVDAAAAISQTPGNSTRLMQRNHAALVTMRDNIDKALNKRARRKKRTA